MTKVYIPAILTNIGIRAFTVCSKLTEICVDANNPAYCDQDGVLYSKDMKVLSIFRYIYSAELYPLG